MKVLSKCLNIGCGLKFNIEWENIDLYPTSKYVKKVDLIKGLPYSENIFEFVYSSHLLEHIDYEHMKFVLSEMLRVLEPNGIVRIVVPDLENIAKEYLKSIEMIEKKEPNAEIYHDWFIMEMYDQVVREKSGGLMAPFISKGKIKDCTYLQERFGFDFYSGLYNQQSKETKKNLWLIFFKKIGFSNYIVRRQKSSFYNSGERHRWMYDYYSLKRLLEEVGFERVNRIKNAISSYAMFADSGLELGTHGKPYRCGSLFIEGFKSNSANESSA